MHRSSVVLLRLRLFFLFILALLLHFPLVKMVNRHQSNIIELWRCKLEDQEEDRQVYCKQQRFCADVTDVLEYRKC